MAPVKKARQPKEGTRKPSKAARPQGDKKTSRPLGDKRTSRPLGDKKKSKGPPPSQQKTKSAKSLDQKKKKRRVYTEEELNIPKLNMITPVGVQKPKGKKKGKVFVDDPTTMQTILAIVNAESEGRIESKMLKARQMEEIREARQREMDAKEQARKDVLENKKDELRKTRRKNKPHAELDDVQLENEYTAKKPRKKVSFG